MREKALGEKEKFIHHLFTKLTYFKLLYCPSAIPSTRISTINWVEILKQKLSSIKELDQERKNKIQSILSHKEISKEEEKMIIDILSLLSTDTLIEIFGELFAYHTTHYIRWGWEFYRSTKQLMLERFFNLSKIAYSRIKELSRLSELEKELHLLKREYEKITLIQEKGGKISNYFSEIQNLQQDRTELMKEFENIKGKNAIWRSVITRNYKSWIETELKQRKDNFLKEKVLITYLTF